MNQKDFTRLVQEALGGTATERAATLAIEAVTRALADGLAEDGEVLLSGFGRFRVQTTPARGFCTGAEEPPPADWLRYSFKPARATILPARPEDRGRLSCAPISATPPAIA